MLTTLLLLACTQPEPTDTSPTDTSPPADTAPAADDTAEDTAANDDTGGDTDTSQPPDDTAADTADTSGDTADTDPLSSLSDEFDDPSRLSEWQRIYQVEEWPYDQLESLDVGETRGGWLALMPYSSSWYQDYRGVLLFKEISGDFIATARVHPTSRSGAGAPTSSYSLAGIMTRSPRAITAATWTPGGEDYIFLSLGAASSPGTWQFEVKETDDSVSELTVSDGYEEAEIRSARVGEAFIVMRRPIGGDWEVHRRYLRADMPETLQVGITVYTDWSTISPYEPEAYNQTLITDGDPDLLAHFDYFRFATPVLPASLEGLDLTDAAQVSDADLLSFLGD